MRCDVLRAANVIVMLSKMPEQEGQPTGTKANDLSIEEACRIGAKIRRHAFAGPRMTLPEIIKKERQRRRARKS